MMLETEYWVMHVTAHNVCETKLYTIATDIFALQIYMFGALNRNKLSRQVSAFSWHSLKLMIIFSHQLFLVQFGQHYVE